MMTPQNQHYKGTQNATILAHSTLGLAVPLHLQSRTQATQVGFIGVITVKE